MNYRMNVRGYINLLDFFILGGHIFAYFHCYGERVSKNS